MKKQFILRVSGIGDPAVNTIATYDEKRKLYAYSDSRYKVNKLYLTPFFVHDSPYWEEVIPIELKLPLGTFIVFTGSALEFKIFELDSTSIYDGRACVHLLLKSNKEPFRLIRRPIFAFNSQLRIKGLILIFETLEEAEEYIILNLPRLSIRDIATVYSSATNPNYHQANELKELIKSK